MLKTSLLKTCISFLLVFTGWAHANISFSEMYVFGDSLSDTGNFSAVNGELPPPFFMNRISNGPVAVDVLAAELGLTAIASLYVLGSNEGTNYAFARGNAIGSAVEDLRSQISWFLSNQGNTAPSDALYVMFIGGNDVRDARDSASFKQARSIVRTAADEVRMAIETLAQAGAHSFLLVNAANIGATPQTRLIAEATNEPELIKRTRRLSNLYRKELHKIAKNLKYDHDEYHYGNSNKLHIVEFDFFRFNNKLLKNAEKLGFTNSTDACFNLPTISQPNPSFHPDCNFGANFDQFIFFDEIHPTSRVHALIGKAFFEALQDDDYLRPGRIHSERVDSWINVK